MSDKNTPPVEKTLPELVAEAVKGLDIKSLVAAEVAEAVKGLSLASKEEAPAPKQKVDLATMTFEVGKRKFGFNFPVISMPNAKGVQTKYTAAEVVDESNVELQKRLVAMLDNEETRFIKEI